MAAMHDDVWDEQAQDWVPDEWDRKAHAVLAYRDQVADSVPGEVPAFGTPEWADADPQTQAAAYARHERDVSAAQGKAVSDRLAAEAAQRKERGEASRAVSAEYTRRGYANNHIPYDELQRRRAVIPQQRTASTAETVARAREACRAATRPEVPVLDEEPPADGHARVRG